MSTHNIHLKYRTPKRYPIIISIVPPGVALIVTFRGSNYRCLEQIFMVPKGFEPLKFDYIYKRVDKRPAGFSPSDVITKLDRTEQTQMEATKQVGTNKFATKITKNTHTHARTRAHTHTHTRKKTERFEPVFKVQI